MNTNFSPKNVWFWIKEFLAGFCAWSLAVVCGLMLLAWICLAVMGLLL